MNHTKHYNMVCIVNIHFQFSRLVVSDSLRPRGLQHTRPPWPWPALRAHSDSCPSSRRCHPTVSSCRPLLLPPSRFPSIRVFSNESALLNLLIHPIHWSLFLSTSRCFHLELFFFCLSISLEQVSGQQIGSVSICLKCVFLLCLFALSCAGSWFLHSGFLQFHKQRLLSSEVCGLLIRSGFSCCRARALEFRLQ